MKPWEETWRAEREHLLTPTTSRGGVVWRSDEQQWYREHDLHTSARARLAAAAPEFVRVLLAVEEGGENANCPACGRWPGRGHASVCVLQAALVKAGVR